MKKMEELNVDQQCKLKITIIFLQCMFLLQYCNSFEIYFFECCVCCFYFVFYLLWMDGQSGDCADMGAQMAFIADIQAPVVSHNIIKHFEKTENEFRHFKLIENVPLIIPLGDKQGASQLPTSDKGDSIIAAYVYIFN